MRRQIVKFPDYYCISWEGLKSEFRVQKKEVVAIARTQPQNNYLPNLNSQFLPTQ